MTSRAARVDPAVVEAIASDVGCAAAVGKVIVAATVNGDADKETALIVALVLPLTAT